jgi:hypothetical protein
VILQGDALRVVQTLMKYGRSWCCYRYLIEEARGVLNCFNSWKVNHVKRNLNKLTHRLAKEALFLTVKKGLIEEIPLYILDIIYVECCA